MNRFCTKLSKYAEKLKKKPVLTPIDYWKKDLSKYLAREFKKDLQRHIRICMECGLEQATIYYVLTPRNMYDDEFWDKDTLDQNPSNAKFKANITIAFGKRLYNMADIYRNFCCSVPLPNALDDIHEVTRRLDESDIGISFEVDENAWQCGVPDSCGGPFAYRITIPIEQFSIGKEGAAFNV